MWHSKLSTLTFTIVLSILLVNCSNEHNSSIEPAKKDNAAVVANDAAKEVIQETSAEQNVEATSAPKSAVISTVTFEEFTVLLQDYDCDISYGSRGKDTISFHEDMGCTIKKFSVIPWNDNYEYEVFAAFEKSMLAYTLDDRYLEMEEWKKMTPFTTSKIMDDNGYYSLSNFDSGKTYEAYSEDFEEIKQSVIDLRKDVFKEYNIKDTSAIQDSRNATTFNELNTTTYNSKNFIKIVKTESDGSKREFVLITYPVWD